MVQKIVALVTEQIQAQLEPIIVSQNAIRDDIATAEVRRVTKALNCWLTNFRTQVECTEFKRSVIEFYGMAKQMVEDRIITAQCMATGIITAYNDLRPAHLVKHSTPQLMSMYNLSPSDVDNPRNGILMLDSIEKAFDHLDVCFLYDPNTSALALKVLNPRLLTKRILPNSVVEKRTFSDVSGSQMHIGIPSNIPYRRILSIHAKFAYARALGEKWIENTDTLRTYFSISDAGLQEPECVRDVTWDQLSYNNITTTV
jgi:HNH endonuclease